MTYPIDIYIYLILWILGFVAFASLPMVQRPKLLRICWRCGKRRVAVPHLYSDHFEEQFQLSILSNPQNLIYINRPYGWILGAQLRELLLKHGSMENIEVQIKKWHASSEGEGQKGKWITKGQLMEVHHYTPISSCM